MNFVSRMALSLAACFVPAVAGAVDYDPSLDIDLTEVEIAPRSGWYVRGDIGYGFGGGSDAYFRSFDPVSDTHYQAAFEREEFGTNLTWGGGVGYAVNEWIRADLTADVFRTRFDGVTSTPSPCVDPATEPAYAGTACSGEARSHMSALTVMANAYLDLGTFVGFTPYFGAGGGFSLVSWDRPRIGLDCVDHTSSCPASSGLWVAGRGAEEWRFTWALMAGLAYDLTEDFKIDLGYRYRRIDGGDMFSWNSAAGPGRATNGDIDMHELRIGLRYEFR
jgi:opacity protein-like surface antigen